MSVASACLVSMATTVQTQPHPDVMTSRAHTAPAWQVERAFVRMATVSTVPEVVRLRRAVTSLVVMELFV